MPSQGEAGACSALEFFPKSLLLVATSGFPGAHRVQISVGQDTEVRTALSLPHKWFFPSFGNGYIEKI